MWRIKYVNILLSVGKHEQSRRNLNKALTIDPVFGPAWLLFGHSFATEREHDQAMAAYFKATQLMKGYACMTIALFFCMVLVLIV